MLRLATFTHNLDSFPGWHWSNSPGVTIRLIPVTLKLFLLLMLLCISESNMDITAFEYYRKFNRHLKMGECPRREIRIRTPFNTTIVRQQACKAWQKGTITHIPRILNDTRHVRIPTANDLVAYLGLCAGEAASYLGILNNGGDCIAIEIASKLAFNRKTIVRAYVEYYRNSLDILEYPIELLRDGFKEYFDNKYYVKYISYGALEVVLVQFRFANRKDSQRANELVVPSPLMSTYMRKVEREVGRPRGVLVLSLSTATDDTFHYEKFSVNEWEAAVRAVEIREMAIYHQRLTINSGIARPHLVYQLSPFIPKKAQAYRTISSLSWEKVSMLEVTLQASVTQAKRSVKICRGNKSKLCLRVQGLYSKLISNLDEIHKGRSEWLDMTSTERQNIAARFSNRVSTFTSVTKSLSRELRQLHKALRLKREKTNRESQTFTMPTSRLTRPLPHFNMIRHPSVHNYYSQMRHSKHRLGYKNYGIRHPIRLQLSAGRPPGAKHKLNG